MADYTYANYLVDNAATQAAQAAAQAAYQKAQAGNLGEQMALARAEFAWKQELDKAAQTGMWNGQWNNPQEQWFTSQFGQWYGPGGAPAAGQQTLSAQQQAFDQAYRNAIAYGQYYAPGTAPNQGQQTLEAADKAQQQRNWLAQTYGGYYGADQTPEQGAQTLAQQQQGFSQGLQTMQEQRAAQAQGQSQTMSYLDLLSRLRGPADWAKYQQVLGSTPGGMRDLAAAAMGQYIPGGGATTGMQPQAASLQSLMGDVSGQAYTGQGGGQLGQPSVYGGGQGAYGYANNGQAGAALGGAGAAPGSSANGGLGQLPAPNQIAAQSWKNMAPSQQQLLLGAYESQGWDKNDVTALMNQNLPKYAGNAPSAGTWRMAA